MDFEVSFDEPLSDWPRCDSCASKVALAADSRPSAAFCESLTFAYSSCHTATRTKIDPGRDI